jgi:hypothetical protein
MLTNTLVFWSTGAEAERNDIPSAVPVEDVDEVDWALDWIGMDVFLPLNDDGSTDHTSSRSEVEQ